MDRLLDYSTRQDTNNLPRAREVGMQEDIYASVIFARMNCARQMHSGSEVE